MKIQRIALLLLTLLLLLLALPAFAQQTTPAATLAVTDDQVNMVAHQLYCPVCENVPLDVCGTPACIQWRADIRSQLEQGKTPDEIIADFVRRFGERVVGTPQDQVLRALSLVTPYALGAMVLAVALWTLWRWRKNRMGTQPQSPDPGIFDQTETDYRARLERDLRERQ